MDNTLLSAVIGGALTLVGALGAQWLSARSALRQRQFELSFEARRRAYGMLLERIGTFAFEPKNLDKYCAFLAAYEAALLVASDEVAAALSDRTGLHLSAQDLRVAPTDADRERIAVTTWFNAVKRATNAMREDIRSTSTRDT